MSSLLVYLVIPILCAARGSNENAMHMHLGMYTSRLGKYADIFSTRAVGEPREPTEGGEVFVLPSELLERQRNGRAIGAWYINSAAALHRAWGRGRGSWLLHMCGRRWMGGDERI